MEVGALEKARRLVEAFDSATHGDSTMKVSDMEVMRCLDVVMKGL